MKKRFLEAFRRNEIYVVATVIGVVFVAAMASVAWLLRSSIVTPPYETLGENDLKKVFATGYLRFREDDHTPYLKLELHNGTLWWIKEVEFEFAGTRYTARDADAFRPLHFGGVRCTLKTTPPSPDRIDYDLKIDKANGYPPVQVQIERNQGKISGKSNNRSVQN